ncbi:MAG: 2-C-methyl-D-erythritol 4-phosphate cytidylyltransferase, partial [Campylobacter sp.]|nr:2-C-methyl-D-erythritol 4-phosphate cytidylyltransferase [Campylobacter sp.]
IMGLAKFYDDDAIVLIHDAIRPNLSKDIISDCIDMTKQYGNAIVCIPCQEAMLETKDKICSESSYPRDNLKRTQTPQGFKLGIIKNAHIKAAELGITNSIASCTLMIEVGEKVFFSMGSEKNIKLTTLEDMEIFKALLDGSK